MRAQVPPNSGGMMQAGRGERKAARGSAHRRAEGAHGVLATIPHSRPHVEQDIVEICKSILTLIFEGDSVGKGAVWWGGRIEADRRALKGRSNANGKEHSPHHGPKTEGVKLAGRATHRSN
jgi:hypothetical protein